MSICGCILDITGFTTMASQAEQSPSFVEKQLLSRLYHVSIATVTAATLAIDMVFVTTWYLVNLTTVGACSNPNLISYDLDSPLNEITNTILVRVFNHLIKTINPDAPLPQSYPTTAKMKLGDDGVLLSRRVLKDAIIPFLEELLKSDSFFEHEILSRMTAVGGALAAVIARITDLAIGSLAAIAALCTLGMVEEVNGIAREGLTATFLIADLHFFLLTAILPDAAPITLST